MNLDVENWKEFVLGRLFVIKKGKRLTSADQEEGEYNYIGAIDSNNGVANHIGQLPIHEGNTISLSYNGSVGEAFYQKDPYWATDDVNALYSRYSGFNQNIGLFMATVIRQEKYKFSYGRKWTLENMNTTIVKLPVKHNPDGTIFYDDTFKYSDEGYVPDWEYMEQFIQSLHYKPLTTKNKTKNTDLQIEKWKEFKVSDLFVVKYGVNLELNACDEVDADEPDSINFVARTAENNGVSARVKLISDVEPQKAGLISVAGGGSVLSTFLQHEPFYSGRDLYTLEAKDSMSNAAKLFIITVIEKNKYKYSYGRQANKTLPDLLLKLPVDDTGYPDYAFMDQYMKSLPYGDRLE